MPIVVFEPSGKKAEVASGTLLFDAASRAGLPVASSCGERFVCGRCNMEILTGAENLSLQHESERTLLKRNLKSESDRISCVTRIYGDCTVKTSYW